LQLTVLLINLVLPDHFPTNGMKLANATIGLICHTSAHIQRLKTLKEKHVLDTSRMNDGHSRSKE